MNLIRDPYAVNVNNLKYIYIYIYEKKRGIRETKYFFIGCKVRGIESVSLDILIHNFRDRNELYWQSRTKTRTMRRGKK